MSGDLSKICKQSMLWLFHAHLTYLKSALQTTPTLGLPDPNKPFFQTVNEKKGFMTSVFLQKHGDRLRPVACFSSKLDPVVAGFPFCLCAVAAAEKAVTASRNIVGYSNLTLLVPHAVSLLLLEKKTSHLSAQRWLKADLKSNPLENPDMVLYVDGSASRNPETGKNKVKEALPKPTEGPLHDLQPGDWIVVKDFRRTKWNKPRWNGPFQVLLTTPLAVKVTGRVTWIHASHCRRVPEPAEQEEKEGLNDPDAGKAREEERHHCMKQCEYHINHARTLNREEYFSV
ncbi:uncharacterized protein LOC132875024 isoform X4 [Neoarius graeffei]|uniref:uncharacterized protein LOC132875024 isoform X4 n=1 Tax=Neoarius graeffei TaxID=443677 RepID=UPI00298D36ED|nr:uncharacterized protein LOC132875024 isoform X4 [Neoarius graeffei]